MPNKRRFTVKQSAEIARLYEQDGLSMLEIAGKFNANVGVVRNSLLRSEVKIRPRKTSTPESEWALCECGSRAVYSKGLCRTCYSRERSRSPEFLEYRFTWKLKNSFSMSREEYDHLLEEQGNVCAICHKPDPGGSRLAVDHDHRCCPTQGIRTCGSCNRGLLCVNCNTALGSLGENVAILRSALSYLENWRECLAA